uniref:Aminotransferase-like plant mobile domain-containing protein n=1 Tax=Hordeum vulgare subsp. vulgare TaxID=112509 RepID=A0A8I6WWQ4_HORVV
MVSLCVIFGGYMYNLGFVHIIRIRFMPRFSSYYSKRPVIIFFILCRMFRPDQYPGLDDYYEQKHRAVLVERGEVHPLLRLRGHNPNETLVYDPRYEPYFRRMDLLQFMLNFKGTPPWLNATALTALTDRWRPETHSFHLPLGEMSITLEDIAMISGLPIEGRALTGKVRAAGWRQRVAALVGVEPEPWTDETRKDPRPSGVLFSWIQRHFHRCPRDASPLVVERFARAYLWNLLTQVVFPDGTGDTASWMFLDPLRDWDVKWSWGSVALAFLYRQVWLNIMHFHFIQWDMMHFHFIKSVVGWSMHEE